VKKVGLIIVGVLALAALVQFVMLLTDGGKTRQAMLDPSGATPRSAADSSDHVTLRVVSDADGAPPIEGARIEGMGTSGPIREKTGADGRATLPRGGQHRLRIQAARFVGVHLPVDLTVSDQTIVLKRTGSATFTTVGLDGKPVEGVMIRLSLTHHDPSGMLPGHEPAQSTDADGIARWENLAPGSKCEWSVTSGHPVLPGEGIEHGGSKAIQLEDGRWAMQSDGSNPFQAKGKFTVADGEEFAITLKVKKTSTVLCRLGIGADAEGTARVELWNKGELPTPSGTFKDHRPERQVDVGVGAAISLPNLTPGRKYIRAGWWDGPGKRAYARLNFELNEGETKDLGTLPRITGHSLELRFVLQGPAEAIERVEKPAKVTIILSSQSINEDLSVVDNLVAEVGAPITITGLNGTTAHVTVMPQLKTRQGETVVDCRQPPPLDLALPVSDPVEIPLILDIKHWIKFEAKFPPLARQTFFVGYALPAGGGPGISLGGPGPQAGSTSARFDAYALPGDYEILVHSRSELNLFAQGTLTIRPDGTNDLKLGDLKTGAILRGRAVTKTGSPYKDMVRFRREGAPQSNGIYFAEPDAEGRFMIGGIVPKSRLTATPFFTHADIEVGEAGSETYVDLTKKD
jgi:hypothetical protein